MEDYEWGGEQTHLLRGAELGHGPVEHVQVIEEIHRCRAPPGMERRKAEEIEKSRRRGCLHESRMGEKRVRTVHCEPLVQILAFREAHRETEVP